MANIILPKRTKTGSLRSDHVRKMKYEWGVNGGLNGEQLDKCKFLEKRKGKKYWRQADIDKVR